MTEIKELIEKLRAHEKRMEFLFDMIVALRDKQTDPALHQSLNSMKYVLSGRPACALEAASALEALTSRSAVMEEALAEMLAAFEAAETRGVPESELQPILRRARSALSQSGKE